MPLRHLNLQIFYRTGRGDMVKDLFVPCLETSILYRRAAGYFTSFGLGLAARGVASLASRKGTMRLVASPHLEPGDIEALRAATERPQDVLKGIFTDEDVEHVAFSGSSNETAGGLVENFESVDVFRSWNDPDGRVAQKIADFDALRENTTPGLLVIDFTAAGNELLEYFRDPKRPPPGFMQANVGDGGSNERFEPPPGFDLDTILVAPNEGPEMVVGGEWVASID